MILYLGTSRVLNFTQNCVSNTKVLRGAKIVPIWASGANIIFSLEGNKIWIQKDSYAPHLIFYLMIEEWGHKSLFISKFYFCQVK